MEASAHPLSVLQRTRRRYDQFGDRALYALTAGASLIAMAIIALIIWKVFDGSRLAIRHSGIGFVWEKTWNPNPVAEVYGAREYIYGTLLMSFGAILLAAPLSIAIGLFLSELAPKSIKSPVASLVDMLAAVPSVVVGLWGILVLGPFMRTDIEPFLHSAFGWTPFFTGTPQQAGVLVAIVVLTMMALPITSSICRELFAGVPRELKEAAIGLGATRWEMVRGVVFPQVRGGVVAGIMLGLGRALGEAIAVTQVCGNLIPIHLSLFKGGNTLASEMASNFAGAGTAFELSSLFYLGLILLVITFITNVAAQRIVHRFESQRTGAR
jgi:phosphate transport system permease protein